MRIVHTLVAAGLSGLLLCGAATAQGTPPATSPAAAPMTAPTAAPMAAGMDKKALSKECSTKADQQGLRGKARKHFRSKCKAGKA